jgi:hypothetical protein
MNSYKFLNITDFELKGGTGILQPDPQKDLNRCNRVLGSPGKKKPRLAGFIPATAVPGGEGEPVRNDQEDRADLAGVM